MNRPHYSAFWRTDGKYFLIYVPAFDSYTQARTPEETEYMARDLIATYLDVESDAFDVTLSKWSPS